MHLFWEQGYERTSLDELLRAMKIQKGSFYNTFGSKRELYIRCLRRYRDQIEGIGPFGSVLEAIRKGPDAVREVFARQLEGLAEGDCTSGCFVASASAEHRGRSKDVLDVTGPSVQAATDALTQAIEEAQDAGAMPSGVDPRKLAYLFITMGYGTQVLAVSGVPSEPLWEAWTRCSD